MHEKRNETLKKKTHDNNVDGENMGWHRNTSNTHCTHRRNDVTTSRRRLHTGMLTYCRLLLLCASSLFTHCRAPQASGKSVRTVPCPREAIAVRFARSKTRHPPLPPLRPDHRGQEVSRRLEPVSVAVVVDDRSAVHSWVRRSRCRTALPVLTIRMH